MQSFDSVTCHPEPVILSRKFRITDHVQPRVVEYFNPFSAEFSSKFARSAFSADYGYNASKPSHLL